MCMSSKSLTRVASLKKRAFSTPSSHKLPLAPPLGVVFHKPFSIYAETLDGYILCRSLWENPVSFKEPIALHALCSAEKHWIFQARSQNNPPQKDNPEWRAVTSLLESCSGAWDSLEEVSPGTSQNSFHLLPEHDKILQCVCVCG